MPRPTDFIPRRVTPPSLLTAAERPAYRAPDYGPAPMPRPFAIRAGGGVVTDPNAAYVEATAPTDYSGFAGGAGSGDKSDCGCSS